MEERLYLVFVWLCLWVVGTGSEGECGKLGDALLVTRRRGPCQLFQARQLLWG